MNLEILCSKDNIKITTELGCPEVNVRVRFGVFAPAHVPESVLNVLTSALEKVLKNSEVVNRAANAMCLAEYMGPQEFRKFIESEYALWKKPHKMPT